QDIYKQTASLARDVAGGLPLSWWAGQVQGNAVTATVGLSTKRFLHTAAGTWVEPGAGHPGQLAVTGSRVPYEYKCSLHTPYAPVRGWDLSGMAVSVIGSGGDSQQYQYWENHYATSNMAACGDLKGFRLTGWTFPTGMSVNVTYGNPWYPWSGTDDGEGAVDNLVKVTNSLGREIDFGVNDHGTIDGMTNGLTGGDLREIGLGRDAQSRDIITDAAGNVTTYGPGVPAAPGSRPGEGVRLGAIFTADNATQPNLQYVYDMLGRVESVQDAINLQVGDGAHGGRDPWRRGHEPVSAAIPAVAPR